MKNKNNFKYQNILIIISIIVIIPFAFIIFSNNSEDSDIKMVSGTEYISGEEGQIIIRLQDNKGKPITDANCIVSLLYPDKSFFFTDRKMQQTSVPGNYFTAFITPSREGIYEEHVRCNTSKEGELAQMRISSSFHVSAGLNMVREISISQREQFNKLFNQINDTNNKLNNEILSINTKINSLEKNIKTIQNNMDTTNSNIKELENDITSIKTDVKSSLNEIKNIVEKNANSSDENLLKLGEAITSIFS